MGLLQQLKGVPSEGRNGIKVQVLGREQVVQQPQSCHPALPQAATPLRWRRQRYQRITPGPAWTAARGTSGCAWGRPARYRCARPAPQSPRPAWQPAAGQGERAGGEMRGGVGRGRGAAASTSTGVRCNMQHAQARRTLTLAFSCCSSAACASASAAACWKPVSRKRASSTVGPTEAAAAPAAAVPALGASPRRCSAC